MAVAVRSRRIEDVDRVIFRLRSEALLALDAQVVRVNERLQSRAAPTWRERIKVWFARSKREREGVA